MLESLDAVMLARIQFAFTISFHIIFPAFTIGLASWLAVVEGLWLRTGNPIYQDIYKMWVKVFAVAFGMGVVSGVVLSYQIGTNWSMFSDKVGNVIGPLLGYEVLTAFFLESSFLGIMLFGWGRVSKRMHFASTCIVAVGTLVSAFWILSANSWMQTPAGFSVGQDKLLYPTSWWEIIFNPSFSIRFFHTIVGAYLTTAFVVAGSGGYYLYRRIHVEHAKVMFKMSLYLIAVLAPIQMLAGHKHGENTLEHQPLKVAAMEANWDRGDHIPLILFGMPNEDTETVDYAVKIPSLSSVIITGSPKGIVPGLKDAPKADRPPVATVFWSFRVMVGLGMAMLFTGLATMFLSFRQKLYSNSAFQLWTMAMSPMGFIAVLAGWFVTEVGRQPWTAYGVLRTSESASPIIAEQVAITLLGFILVYGFVFTAGTYYIFSLIYKGPKRVDPEDNYYDHSMEASVIKATLKGEPS